MTARRFPATYTLISGLLLVVAGLLTWSILRAQPVRIVREATPAATPQSSDEPYPVSPGPAFKTEEQTTIELFRRASPSVVHIESLAIKRDLRFNVMEIPRGTGTGFVWDTAGHIVTNYHVVEDAPVVRVTMADGSTYEATRVGEARHRDLTVLRISSDQAKLTPLELGKSGDLQVGQHVMAIGNPFGLDQTLTTGVISGLNREIESVTRRPIQGVIQTDAAINPGNSGGPLLDSSGRLIGVNTAIYSPSGAYAGVGFAIPVDTVNRIVPQLITNGRVVKPGLGLQIAQEADARRLGLHGVLIIDVQPDSAAAAAGLRGLSRNQYGMLVLGDVIVGIEDRPVDVPADLFRILDRHEIGDKVTLKLRRGGHADHTVEVTLQAVE